MVEKVVKVSNRAGIHARPASVIVSTIFKLKSEVFFESGDNRINAKSILGVITLGAAYGTQIKITCEGPDENEAMDILVKLFESKFEEQ